MTVGNTLNNKAPYSRPKISIYGEFANLTAGGTGSQVEGTKSSAQTKKP